MPTNSDTTIFGFDLGTKTGYAWTHTGKANASLSGHVDLKPRRHEGGGMRFLRFRKLLQELMPSPHDDEYIVFYEEVASHKGTAAAHIYGGLLGVLCEFCESRDIPYRGLPVGTIKKHATGRGNASKADMVARAHTVFGKPGSSTEMIYSDDQADALWTLSLGLKELNE